MSHSCKALTTLYHSGFTQFYVHFCCSATIKTSISQKLIPAESLSVLLSLSFLFSFTQCLLVLGYRFIWLSCNMFVIRQLDDARSDFNSICANREEGGKGGDPEFIKVGQILIMKLIESKFWSIYRTSSRRALTLMNSSRSTSLSGANSAERRKMTSRSWRTSRPSARWKNTFL